jgi:hypothetical protein
LEAQEYHPFRRLQEPHRCPSRGATGMFSHKPADYRASKGTIQIPDKTELPLELIGRPPNGAMTRLPSNAETERI